MAESGKPTLLLIDSRDQVLAALQRTLGKAELVCRRAECGEDALAIMQSSSCFLGMIFLDQPNCSPQVIIDWLAQRDQERMVPVILLGQRALLKDMIRHDITLSTVDFVEMPVLPEILQSKVSFFLEFHHRNLRLEEVNENLREYVAEAESLGEQALAADQAKTRFLARMSHEIRTPMTAILGYADLAQRLLRNCPKHHDVQFCRSAVDNISVVVDNTRHLMALIDDIIDVSKIQSGHMVIEYVDCSVLDIVASVVTLYQGQVAEKGIDLQVETPGLLPRIIQSDPTRLRQALMNLMDNAVKFTERGSINVSMRWIDADRDSIFQVQIDDTGCGIDAEQMRFVLNPFEQENSDITRHYGGTGLGLTLTHRIATILGGQLDLKSKKGQGTTVTLSLPTGVIHADNLLENPAECFDALMQPVQMPTHDQMFFKGRILLAEDTPANRKLIAQMLQIMGLYVGEAVNGEEAFQMVLDHDYDLILMDLHMPVCSGYEATERLRLQGVTTPIVALTADVLQSTRERCQSTGFSGFVAKPIDYGKLVDEFKRHLEVDENRSAQLRELEASSSHLSQAGVSSSSGKSTNPDILDPNSAIAQMHVDMATYLGALQQTLPWLDEQILSLIEALEQADAEVVGRQAHAIKSASGTLAMPQVHSLAYALEMTAKGHQSGDMTDLSSQLKDALKQAGQAALQFLGTQGDEL